MRELRGRTAILTGGAGGLGRHLAQHLGRAGIRLLLTDRPGTGLADWCGELRREGYEVVGHEGDLREATQRRAMVEQAETRWGGVDLLINNAGVEYSAVYHELSEERIGEVLEVNLAGAMLLTRLVLPGMAARQRGHIVNLASLAGKSGAAYQEPYAAAKAGLVAFTLSLRSTYRGSGVSASVICPGFVETGIYRRIRQQTGRAAPGFLGACSPEQVAQAVLRAIVRDVPEIILNRVPVRPLLALSVFFPGLGLWLSSRLGVTDFFRAAMEAQRRLDREG
jgi:short-subunit dehydrogenase